MCHQGIRCYDMDYSPTPILASATHILTHWGWDKWPPFCRRYFQVHFFEWKLMNFENCSLWFNWQYDSIGPDNGFASNRRQAIISINHGFVYWHIYASLSLNEVSAQQRKHQSLTSLALCGEAATQGMFPEYDWASKWQKALHVTCLLSFAEILLGHRKETDPGDFSTQMINNADRSLMRFPHDVAIITSHLIPQ